MAYAIIIRMSHLVKENSLMTSASGSPASEQNSLQPETLTTPSGKRKKKKKRSQILNFHLFVHLEKETGKEYMTDREKGNW